jgi:thioredoxin reductase
LSKRIAIIGAGPIGLECALLGTQKGFDVTVFEADEVAQNVQAWGHVRLFSPFGINSSTWGRAAVKREFNNDIPDDNALLTGHEFCRSYLLPVAKLSALRGAILEHHQVQSISRMRLWKGDRIGQSSRLESPFRLLVLDKYFKQQRLVESDYVFDCSGVFSNHNWVGAGGIPAIGEQSNTAIVYGLPDILESDRQRYANQRVLVIGSGFSAATSVVSLAKLRASNPKTEVTWITRTTSENTVTPMTLIANDPLPERESLASRANAAIENDVTWRPEWAIEAIQQTNNSLLVSMTNQSGSNEQIEVDQIIANVGFRPDNSLHQELQVHQCYASDGPIKLAASLMGQTSADCMTQGSFGPQTLLNPEPGFLILGAKSYGRDSRFLLRIGIEQVQAAYSLIESEWS